jgi:hypothetical protein
MPLMIRAAPAEGAPDPLGKPHRRRAQVNGKGPVNEDSMNVAIEPPRSGQINGDTIHFDDDITAGLQEFACAAH